MAPSKLSEEDKQEIFHRYRNTDETTSTLAKQFGVSVSTISRFLKSQLSPTEYDDLVRQKRLAGGRSGGDNDTGNDTGTATTNESSVSTGDRTEQMEQADGANEAEAQPAEATPVTATETTDWDAADPGAGELTGAEVTGAESIASAPIPAPRAAGLAAWEQPAAESSSATTGTLGLTLDGVGFEGAGVPPLAASLPVTAAAGTAPGATDAAEDGDASGEDLGIRTGRRKRRRTTSADTPDDRSVERSGEARVTPPVSSPTGIAAGIDVGISAGGDGSAPVSSGLSNTSASLEFTSGGLTSETNFGPTIPPITQALPNPTSATPQPRDRSSQRSAGVTPSGLPLPLPRSSSRPTPPPAAQISLWADPELDDTEMEREAEASAPTPGGPTTSAIAPPVLRATGSAERGEESASLDEEADEEADALQEASMAEYLAALGDDFSASEDEDEDDFEDEEEGDEAEGPFSPAIDRREDSLLQVLPLTVANLPETGYLVIDRSAELVTCPLATFEELGQIPPTEAQQKTLPLFDNHRVARRFSRQNQRVVKVPNTYMIHKTLNCLGAKGITRLLVDGQVYSLES
ncbi:MAG: hypothetical protein VKJ85_12295 [Prochlorothrix sp.]|nr:hypothetical protein [Prochlorothrix sp.]